MVVALLCKKFFCFEIKFLGLFLLVFLRDILGGFFVCLFVWGFLLFFWGLVFFRFFIYFCEALMP